jgi:SpoVK/Ycf46/Vps4 family AAA+-type ATPase
VKPLEMNDLAGPAPLPNRPLPARQVSDTNSRTLASPSISRGGSRSPSPEKKTRMKSTLRPGGKTRTPSTVTTTKPTRPQVASKAASQAWTSKDNAKVLLPAEPSGRLSLDGSGYLHPKLRAARVRSTSPPPSRSSTRAVVNEPRAHNTEYDDFDPEVSRIQSASPHLPLEPKSSYISRSRPRPSDPVTRRIDNMALSSPAKPNTASKMNRTPLTQTSPGANRRTPTTSPVESRSRHTPKTIPSKDSTIAVKRRPVHPLPALPVVTRDHDPFEDGEEQYLPEVDQSESESEEEEEEDEEPTWLERSAEILDNLPRGVDHHAAEQILNEVIIMGDEVHWEDIAGLDIAKAALKENVVYPFLRPDLFKGLREPARGILLFGPPGTGKTMLARAVATESKSTFFAVSASSLISKFLGESEKLVRALFALAKMMAPSVIFVDEIDSLLSSRSDQGEHETSRRIKTEFLIQWSDLARAAAGRDAKVGDPGRVLVLAATNAPWAIDDAARRRFVRRQYIPLPEGQVRATQVRTLLSEQKHDLSDADVQKLIERTQGITSHHQSIDSNAKT